MLLCCGEALIDMIPAPVTTGGEGFVPHSGGAVFNTAIAMGRLGAPSGMLTGLSTDLFGQQLASSLADSKVNTDLCVRSDQPTTLAFVNLINGHATYTFYDENSAGRMLSPDDMPSLPADVTALFFGGISLMVEPCALAYEELLCRSSDDRVIMLDPNIRPSFIKDVDRYRARLTRILAHCDIVKVSDEDLDWILPEEASADDKAQRLQSMGPSVVIITRGGDGATAYLKNGEQVSVPSRRVEVVDTVGAGDTFNAGVLAGLFKHDLLSKQAVAELQPGAFTPVLELGMKAAAISVSRAGANPPWLNELD